MFDCKVGMVVKAMVVEDICFFGLILLRALVKHMVLLTILMRAIFTGITVEGLWDFPCPFGRVAYWRGINQVLN